MSDDIEFSTGFLDGVLNESMGVVQRLAAPLKAVCQSPIEMQFGAGFLFLTHVIGFPSKIITSFDDEYSRFAILPQAQIDPYRVDFVVFLGRAKAVVECDGREFHYANREQIERDRERDRVLEGMEYKVFRFPGTQLHLEPVSCAGDVMLWLLKDFERQHPGEKI